MSTIAIYLAYPLYYYIAFKMTEGYVRRFGPVWYHGFIIGFLAIILGAGILGIPPEIPRWLARILGWILLPVVQEAYLTVKRERKGNPEQQEAL